MSTAPHSDPNCIFCKIVAGQIPSRKAYEDEELLAFHDIHPWAPVHVLVIPKRHIASMADVTDAEAALLGRRLDETALHDAAVKAMAACDPAEDLRGDRAYKTAMAGQMLRRALQRAATRC